MNEGDAGQEQPTADAAESFQQGASQPVHYHLELSPAQLKITHTALKSLLDDFGHEEADVLRQIKRLLAKLPTPPA